MRQPDPVRLRAVVDSLAAAPFRGRRVGTDGGRAAADHLARVLRRAGATVAFQDFTVGAAVRDLYGVPTMTWTHRGVERVLDFRRDFCEHLASADLPYAVAGRVSAVGAPGTWVLHDSFSHEAVTAAADAGAVGVLVPRGTDTAGWMPKMITEPAPAALPVLAVRTDIHGRLRARGTTVGAAVPVRSVDIDGRNVIATFREHLGGGPAFLLTAHFDGVGDDPDGTRFPAACDNASGVAAVIEAARILHRRLPAGVGLAVALLDGEEAGAHGSAVHARTLAFGSHVLNLDGAAELGEAHVEAGGPAEPLLAALDRVGRRLGVPLRARAMPSDNRRYAAAGHAAVGIGMGMPGYQTPLETPDRVGTATLVAAAELLVGTVEEAAAAPVASRAASHPRT
ncbi:M28 family metallopeptidase [Nocardiopsis dassonvillei]|uniref:M28 family metallopeptidase n=1 Tax=Nocardiopsis dassonvillei TaxID=2014 RepID=UPI003F57C579